MKINTMERIMIVLLVAVLSFFGGYYYRGTAAADTILVETEKTPERAAELSPIPSVQETPVETPVTVPITNDISDDSEPADIPERTVPQSDDGLIDLNTATQEELESLPGIGPVLAERIIAYREAYGGFYSIEEIQYVDGIGEKTFENLANLIKVEVEK